MRYNRNDMGLDVVELIMRVEETFEIEIGDEEASELITVGQLYTCILGKLGLSPSDRCLSSVAFYRVRRALMGLSDVPRHSIRPSTETEVLLPHGKRKQHWDYVARMTGSKLPDLERPRWMQNLIWGVSCLLAGSSLFVYILSSFYLAALWFVGSLLFAWLAYRVSTPFAVQLPADCATVEGVTRAILRLNYGVYVQKEKTWNEKEVWETLHDVIVDELSVKPEAVTKEAQFARDLRLD